MRQLLHICIIILVLFSICVETYLYVNTSLPILNYPENKIGRIIYYYSYFTVLSNLSIGIISLLLLLNPNRDSTSFRILRLDGLVCITITSIVYNLILRNGHPHSGIMSVTNELLHVVIPVLGILVWLLYGPKPRIEMKTIFLSIIPPFLYVIYIFVRGKITQLYPYPFLDVGKIGFIQAVANTSVILILFLGLEYLFYFTDKKISGKSDIVQNKAEIN